MKNKNKSMGADIATIGKATMYQELIDRIMGVAPNMNIQETSVLLYYPPEKIKQAQRSFSDMIQPGEPSDVQMDILPVIVEPLLKKYALHLLIGGVVFYYIAKHV